MTEVRTIARQIQQLETYLNNLVSALSRGELPVNLQPITQIFDRAIASLPPTLNLPPEKFVELYRDLPQLFSAYAIDVTLSSESYLRQINDIIFQRFVNGNYWIIPIESRSDTAWLVPNPFKNSGSLERMPSLDLSFDRLSSTESDRHQSYLVAPAIVQILPIVEPLTWKLVERGKFSNDRSTNSDSIVESLVNKLTELNDRILKLDRESVKQESFTALVNKQEQLQAISSKLIELQQNSANLAPRSTGESTDNLKEIISLKIDLEKLKQDLQRRQRQQEKQDKALEERVRLLVEREIVKLQPSTIDEIETIEAEFVTTVPVLKEAKEYLPTRQNISPFAALYNLSEQDFVRAYMFSTASLMKDNGGRIKLVEDNVGHYWIIPLDRTAHYLVPKMDFPNYNNCLEVLALLFDGATENTNFKLFKPAIVTVTKANMPKQWQLEQKGYLDPLY